MKECKGCTTRYAHTLGKCPHCSGTEFEMSWDADKATEEEATQEQPVASSESLPTRPKDTDSLVKWRSYAKALDDHHNVMARTDYDSMTKPQLIAEYGDDTMDKLYN